MPTGPETELDPKKQEFKSKMPWVSRENKPASPAKLAWKLEKSIEIVFCRIEYKILADSIR